MRATATGNKSIFFCSSRRRHTRYWRDWSSDVCSSDLVPQGDVLAAGRSAQEALAAAVTRSVERVGELEAARNRASEDRGQTGERGVGREWRSLWAAYHLKKKIPTPHGLLDDA